MSSESEIPVEDYAHMNRKEFSRWFANLDLPFIDKGDILLNWVSDKSALDDLKQALKLAQRGGYGLVEDVIYEMIEYHIKWVLHDDAY